MALKSAEGQPVYPNMRRRFHAAALPAVLAAAAIIISSVSALPFSADAAESIAADSSENPEEESGIHGEKLYLLQAVNWLDDAGVSPIALWAKVTKNERVLDRVKSVGYSAADMAAQAMSEKMSETENAVSEKVQEAGTAAAEQAGNAVQEQVGKAKKGFLEKLKEWLQKMLETGKESDYE